MLLGLTYVTPVSFIVQFLVALVGLGVAIDYSLLVVTRWREERARGCSNEEAIVVAMETAGRAVFVSGLTVAVGLLSLIVLPVPFLRSTGIGGALIPLISMAVVLTLVPALLSSVGPKWDWPRIRNEARPSRAWHGWAAGVARRPVLSAAAAIVLLALAISPVFHLLVGQTSAAAEARKGTAHQLYTTLEREGVPAGVLTPMEVLVRSDDASTVVGRFTSVTGVRDAAIPAGRAGTRRGLTDVLAVPAIETVNSATLGPTRATEQSRPGSLVSSGWRASVPDSKRSPPPSTATRRSWSWCWR